MKTMMRSLRSGMEFLMEAAGRLFTPAEEPPAIGTMPFGNDPYIVWEEA